MVLSWSPALVWPGVVNRRQPEEVVRLMEDLGVRHDAAASEELMLAADPKLLKYHGAIFVFRKAAATARRKANQQTPHVVGPQRGGRPP